MNGRHLFLTSSGLSSDMKKMFFDIIGKRPEDVKVLCIPTAGIETDGAREGIAVCLHELSLMGIRYENILVYNLELVLSKDYKRTYSAYLKDPFLWIIHNILRNFIIVFTATNHMLIERGLKQLFNGLHLLTLPSCKRFIRTNDVNNCRAGVYSR